MLLVLLGGVTLLMRMLQQPRAAERLGEVMAMPTAADDERRAPAAARAPLPGDAEAWSAVRDNALFLPQEQPAWFGLLEQAQAGVSSDTAAPPEATYAQLVSQPEAYRGQPVRIRGTVVRESVKRLAENDLGLTEYHQLVISPRGGGEWPIVVYALELPQGFPRGDGLRAAVAVDGLFFKVWSFAHDDGAGLAPVIVAQAIDWQPPTDAPRESNTIAAGSLWPGLVIAAAFAACVVAWVSWQTRRPRPAPATEAADPTRDALRRLGDAEVEP
jgi:hypothetical protein